MDKRFNVPVEIAENFVKSGIKKTSNPAHKQLLFGFMAGMFLALVCQATNMAIYAIPSVGLAKTLASVIFPAGLIIIVLAGSELFTGNCLNILALMERKISPASFCKNLALVYIGNLLGSIFIAGLMILSGQFMTDGGMLGAYTIKVAASKAGLDFIPALTLGIMCNVLVCVAIWVAGAATDAAGKIMAMFFPVCIFVLSGFEHCIANMYYIPAGIFAKINPELSSLAQSAYNVSPEQINSLNFGSMFFNNLLPVTIGNFIGGAILVGAAYHFLLLSSKKREIALSLTEKIKPQEKTSKIFSA